MNEEMTKRFLDARRAVIAGEFSDLNPRQQEAVLTTQGPLLVLAGAGSGKTTVLIRRVANLLRFGAGSEGNEIPEGILDEDVALLEGYLRTRDPSLRDAALSLCVYEPVDPWRIIAITFTNKAAGELKDRLCSLLGPEAESVWAMTFHAACCRMLRRDAQRLGYTSSFTIYDSGDSQSVIKAILKDRDLDTQDFQPKAVASAISRAKDLRQSPEDYAAAQRGDSWKQQVAELYAEYQTRLKNANAMDFDDLLLNTVALLEQNPDILDYYQTRFRYVLVDEYQDTNPLQYQLTALLAAKHQNICVVGDDDQSIYRFRGATIENILSFEQNYPKARVIRLEQNYRSTGYILQAANQVISHNRGRKGKTLWTQKPEGDRLRVYEAATETEEANWVAQQILTDIARGGAFSGHAVLYRTNTQSNALEAAFRRSGVPYRIIGGTRFYDRAEVKDMLAYLWVLNNRADDLRLRRIINTPARGLGGKTLETVETLALARGVPLYDIVSDPYSYPELGRSASKLMAFTVLLEELAEKLETLPLPDFYQAVMEQTGYLAMLQEKKDDQNRNREENIRELGSTILSYVKDVDEPSLGDFLEEVSLYTDIDQYDPGADGAVMMTIHGAKGLEFPQVFLVGLEEGLFPSSKSQESSEDLEEERRLCYVALTRAKEQLCLSYARSRTLYGKTTSNRPSRFLSELPEEALQWLSPRYGKSSGSRSDEWGYEALDGYEDAFPRSGGYGSYGSRQGSGYGRPAGSNQGKPASKTTKITVSGASKPAKAALSLKTGDAVQHKTFGRGMVLTVQPMGGDALVEIAFDGEGIKKLMLNTAARFLTKL